MVGRAATENERVAAVRPKAAAVGGSRSSCFGGEHGWLPTAIVGRAALAEPRRGPCIVEEYDATCVLPPGATAGLDAHGNIIVTLDWARRPG